MSYCFTILALILNVITLIIVIVQTNLTRKSLDITQKSFINEKIDREIQSLTRMNILTSIESEFNIWLKELEKIFSILKNAMEYKNENEIHELYNKYILKCISPGTKFVDKWLYDNAPEWLSELYICGAEYYARPMRNLKYLLDKNQNNPIPNWSFISSKPPCESLMNMFEEAINALNELKKYLNTNLPDVVLNTPYTKRFDYFR